MIHAYAQIYVSDIYTHENMHSHTYPIYTRKHRYVHSHKYIHVHYQRFTNLNIFISSNLRSCVRKYTYTYEPINSSIHTHTC